jgi:hypothetical protein
MAGTGKITSGLTPGGLVERTITFIHGSLAAWRDDPERPSEDAEEALNGQLCKFLNERARSAFPMVSFHHEERQGNGRKVDLSAAPAGNYVGSGSIYKPVLVIEGKRLPPPSTDREREYLTGFEHRSGGIQRFKLALHGGELERAMMIGYVQTGTLGEWMRRLNGWVDGLAASGSTGHENWDESDRLTDFAEHSGRTASCRSEHARPSGARIRLEHAWVEMRLAPELPPAAADDSKQSPVVTAEWLDATPSDTGEPFPTADE